MNSLLLSDLQREELQSVPWFERIGQPVKLPVERMSAWQEWPGPESELTEAIHLSQQSAHDALLASVEESPQLERLFQDAIEFVLRIARSRVPYDEGSDTWHAPSTALWHAAWTAALVVSYSSAGLTLPQDIEAQWHWFREGHWPAALSQAADSGEMLGYLVY